MAKGSERNNAITVYCRACRTRIRFHERPELFDIVSCPECGKEFEIVGVSPVRLDWPSTSDDDGVESNPDTYYDIYDDWSGKLHQFSGRS